MKNNFVIKNAHIITPYEVIENGQLYVENGKIMQIGGKIDARIQTIIDAQHAYLFPGLIDLHNDGMEKELQPRPNSMFPLEQSLFSLENRLLSHGITTIYHSISLTQSTREVRDIRFIQPLVDKLNQRACNASIRHLIHMRYEITEPVFADYIIELMKTGKIHMASFMDHTPGQGQYRNPKYLIEFMKTQYHWNNDEIHEMIAYKKIKSQDPSLQNHINKIIKAAKEYKIPLASHDDDTIDKLHAVHSQGISISEFPIALEVAKEATRLGMYVMVGAPNIIMNKSTSGNLRGIEAIKNNAAQIICSDYYSPGMLHAVFSLAGLEYLSLPEAVKMVSLNPARAAGIDTQTGSIEEGKTADMILVAMNGDTPFITKAFVAGNKVYEKNSVVFDNTGWLDSIKQKYSLYA